LVFTRDDGSPLRLAYPNEMLNIVIKNITFIELLFIVYAIHMLSLSLKRKQMVQERFGHSDIQMTITLYTDVTDRLKEQTAENFQSYI
jgi:integrase